VPRDVQTAVAVELREGPGPGLDAAVYLGTLTWDDMPRAPRGSVGVKLALHTDAEGLLSAMGTAVGVGGGASSPRPLVVEKRKPAWFGGIAGPVAGEVDKPPAQQLGLLGRLLGRSRGDEERALRLSGWESDGATGARQSAL
jgi:hypothetical protein